MYVNSALRRALVLGAVCLLAVAAMIAWTTHRPQQPAPAIAPVAGQMNAYGEPMNVPVERREAPVVDAVSPFTPSEPRYTAPPPEPYRYAAAVVPATPMAESPRPVMRRAVVRRGHHYYNRPSRRVVVVRRRPFRRSAEIVAGSAAGGALIGGLAGGGKGAGIGAVAAGTGCLIYDRLTHKKREVVTR